MVPLALLALAADPAPVLVRTVELPGVGGPADNTGIPGRLDHFAYSPTAGLLFVCCVANGSVEVIDLAAGKRAGSIPGLKDPQGAVVVGDRLFVATAKDGRLNRFDARAEAPLGSAAVGDDADNVRAGPDGVWVSHAGGLTRVDPETLAVTATIKTPRMPEGFQLDPAGGRAVLNLPAGKRTDTPGTVRAVRPPGGVPVWERMLPHAGNFPLAFDPAGGRVFVATRRPARLLVLAAADGAVVGDGPCPAESDDLFLDGKSGRVVVVGGGSPPGPGDAGGAGAELAVFTVDAAGKPTRVAGVPLPPHARTGAFAADRGAVFVGVPARAGKPAGVREYRLGPDGP